MAQVDGELAVPHAVVHVHDETPLGHADDVHQAVHLAQCGHRVVQQALHVGPDDGVARPGGPAHLLGDLRSPIRVDVHAHHPGAALDKRMAGLAPHPLPRADHHEAFAVEAEQIGIVRDRRAVRAGHAVTLPPYPVRELTKALRGHRSGIATGSGAGGRMA